MRQFFYTISIILLLLSIAPVGYAVDAEEDTNPAEIIEEVKQEPETDEPFIIIIQESAIEQPEPIIKDDRTIASPKGKKIKNKPLSLKDLKDNSDASLILYNKITELEEQLRENINEQEIHQKKIQDLEIKVQNLEVVMQLLQGEQQERKKEKFIKDMSVDKKSINATQTYPKSGIAIYNKLIDGKINEAELDFKKFIKDNPKSSFIPEATYYLGEIYFYYEDYPVAVRYFVTYYKENEKGNKAPNALVKMTLSFSAMDKKQETCLTAEKVLSTYNLKTEVKETILEVAKKNACSISNINPKKTP